MWFVILCSYLIVGRPRVMGQGYLEYDDDVEDFYKGVEPRILLMPSGPEDNARVRRFQNQSDSLQSLSDEEVDEVRGALENILSGRTMSGLSIHHTSKGHVSQRSIANDNYGSIHDQYIATIKVTNGGTESIFEEFVVESIRPTKRIEPIEYEAETDNDTTVIFKFRPVDDYENDIGIARQGKKQPGANIQRNGTMQPGGGGGVPPPPGWDTPPPGWTRPTTKKTPPRLDIPKLLDIIANLTYDYETNLTMQVNETLQKYNIPTCATAEVTTTTTTTPTTTTTATNYDYESGNNSGVIMAKCFVCGLEVDEIPFNAHCADAFAGDFLPLVPVDPTARGQISVYRKYCRYLDVPRYHYNSSDPRSLWGRWTGGCSVRWIDLSGIYTQRSCRNRHKAILGRHFVSKRMAKLEMALQHVENGCIISPMASLVPFSRGISLYARFHACVCTGNWCNRASSKEQWVMHHVIFTILALYYAS